MAKYSQNSIYTYVREKILAKYSDIYITGTYEPVPPKGLAVRITEINHYRPLRYVDLNDEDDVCRMAFDVNVYSNKFNGHSDEVYDVMKVAEEAFRGLHFIEYECVPVERVNNRVSRLTARFEKIIGGGDVLPELETS